MHGRKIRYISVDVVRQRTSKRDVEIPRLSSTYRSVELALENLDSLLDDGIMPEVSAIGTVKDGYGVQAVQNLANPLLETDAKLMTTRS
ncbi:hypothetical protein AciX9_3118 [Granulicella tundricola MP5ACTX9]|uniref:Uncharacterized protein n=2 Tax=Granulicella TaxID=940557 RepID=E8X0V0_GRATM|nr:hypothetical protein AciX9_3118 [Granulicella tundricola MP5ACTX9]